MSVLLLIYIQTPATFVSPLMPPWGRSSSALIHLIVIASQLLFLFLHLLIRGLYQHNIQSELLSYDGSGPFLAQYRLMAPCIIRWKSEVMTMGHKTLCRLPLTSLIRFLNTFPLLITHQPHWPLLCASNVIMLLPPSYNINWPLDTHMAYSLIYFQGFA